MTVNAHAVLNGARTIRFKSDGGCFSYWVSPSDYRPLRVEDRLFRAIGRFAIVRILTGASALPRLLLLQAQQRLILNSRG